MRWGPCSPGLLVSLVGLQDFFVYLLLYFRNSSKKPAALDHLFIKDLVHPYRLSFTKLLIFSNPCQRRLPTPKGHHNIGDTSFTKKASFFIFLKVNVPLDLRTMLIKV
jgi:hypothetical protein